MRRSSRHKRKESIETVESIGKENKNLSNLTIFSPEKKRKVEHLLSAPAPMIPEKAKITPDEIPDDVVVNILDTFSWVLQTNSSDCVASTIVNNHLLIASNSIFKNVRKTNETAAYIDSVVTNLSRIVRGTVTTDAPDNELRQTIKSIFSRKMRGDSKSYISISLKEEELSYLVDLFTNEYFNSIKKDHEPNVSIDSNARIFGHSSPNVAAGIEMGNKILRRLWRIHKHFERKDSALACALANIVDAKEKSIPFLSLSMNGSVEYDHHKWLLNDLSPGYGIVAMGDTYLLHCEMKILDYLLASRIITSKDIDMQYYIGVSKRCCMDCYRVIESFNSACENKVINVSGFHTIPNQSWSEPIFLLNLDKRKSEDSEYGLYDALKNKISGFFYSRDNERTGFVDILDYVKKNNVIIYKNNIINSAYLYRDYALIKKIKNIYKKQKPPVDLIENSEDKCMSNPSPVKKVSSKSSTQINSSNSNSFFGAHFESVLSGRLNDCIAAENEASKENNESDIEKKIKLLEEMKARLSASIEELRQLQNSPMLK